MQLQEALAVVKAEVQRRIQSLKDVDSQLSWLGSLPAEGCDLGSPPCAWEPKPDWSKAVAHVPAERPKPSAPAKSSESGTRRSKWLEPVGKALSGGPKGIAELERVLGAFPASFVGPVLQKYPNLFRKNGEGRGSTWELTEAGKREFQPGKA